MKEDAEKAAAADLEAIDQVKQQLKAYWDSQIERTFQATGGKPLTVEQFFNSINRGLDANMNGEISLDEVKQYVKTRADRGLIDLADDWEQQVEAEFKKLDTNNDGKISNDEIVEAYKASGKVKALTKLGAK